MPSGAFWMKPDWAFIEEGETIPKKYDDRAEEGAALASRAPLDLRVNTLKGDRDKVAAMLADLKPEPTRWSPWGLRIRLAADAKSPPIHAEPAFLKGQIEVQEKEISRAKPPILPVPEEERK